MAGTVASQAPEGVAGQGDPFPLKLWSDPKDRHRLLFGWTDEGKLRVVHWALPVRRYRQYLRGPWWMKVPRPQASPRAQGNRR